MPECRRDFAFAIKTLVVSKYRKALRFGEKRERYESGDYIYICTFAFLWTDPLIWKRGGADYPSLVRGSKKQPARPGSGRLPPRLSVLRGLELSFLVGVQ